MDSFDKFVAIVLSTLVASFFGMFAVDHYSRSVLTAEAMKAGLVEVQNIGNGGTHWEKPKTCTCGPECQCQK